jgi:hypothetical protein
MKYNLEPPLYYGCIKEIQGQSRFTVFLYTGERGNVENSRLLTCYVRRALKTRYRNSPKRLNVNDIVQLEYENGFDKGTILEKVDKGIADEIRELYKFPVYEA